LKDILVTGAYGGMGSAVIELLSNSGFRIFALDRRVGEPRENIVPIECDITSEEDIKKAYSEVDNSTDGLFAVIHFAGIYMLDSLVEMKPEMFRKIFDINVQGAFLVNKIFMPKLKAGSRIIITTSELAPLGPLPFTGIYAVTKAALDKYAYSLRMELQLLGISVSVIRAGAVETDMLGASTDALDRFCEKTELYSCNAERFRKIVNRVEARCIPPRKLAERVLKILGKRKPKFAYSINRNPLLRLLDILPVRMQMWIIRKILK